LDFDAVEKAFGGLPVLRGLTARVDLRKVTFVVGRSGQGKSVLCRLAVGLETADAGRITLAGHRVEMLGRSERLRLRREFPYLVQSPALLDWMSLRDNVALAAREGPGRDVDAALERVGVAEHARKLPPEVPPGVRKRAAIARALVLGPRCLVLDEPTTGLDRAAASRVNALLGSLRQEGLGAVVVSHDYRSLASTADEVLMVSEGRTAYQGSADGFLSSPLPEIRALTRPGEAAGVDHG
jgi:ABC-type transporter Mla maintaining outer membrane lipid asymmetry ATPase subunit MlaF